MFIGFDYGTANCSVAIMQNGQPLLLKMENESTLLPSMLCAPTREAVSEWLFRHHQVPATAAESQALLRRAVSFNREEDIDVTPSSVQFGLSSLGHYIDDPEEVYFVKSPKSFLGASGLKPQQVAMFEDLVCAMMLHIRNQAQTQVPEAIDQAVIGRPINFQGLGGDEANQQAQGILERAAHRAGFRDVVFQYEPVAAGLDFEATLTEEKRVLVVDIGGGSRRIAEMIQSDWAKVGVKAKIVSYEWGEYLSGMRKGEHDSALFGWMSDNGDPDNFADVLLGCNSIKTGSNAARWCNKDYDALVQKAKLTSNPDDRAKLYSQAQEIFYQQAPWIALANGKTFYATRSNVTGYSVSLMGSDFSKAKLN